MTSSPGLPKPVHKPTRPTLFTAGGSRIQRYKNIVGKHIYGRIYVHTQYAHEVIPETILRDARARLAEFAAATLWPDAWRNNTVVYDTRQKSVRFDAALNFDTAREPHAGRYFTVSATGGVTPGYTDSIWHHKWLWVKDDYQGFSVTRAYNWSRKWLAALPSTASGIQEYWRAQLKCAGLR